jgi:SAM-dependent MidA family methyltransferase
LDGIVGFQPQLYQTLTYRFIEAEPSLQAAQSQMCSAHEARLAWSSPADLAAGRLAITGCFLSNELIDAFPTHLVEMTAEGLREVYVAATEAGFAEVLGEPSRPEITLYFARLGIWPEPGQRAEVNLAAGEWLGQVEGSLQRGFVLTIDYGYEAMELYGPMRKNGTLLCYHQHQVVDDPYLRPGAQDITSHVDFTTLQQRGEELGLATVWFGEQYRFLMATGMMDELLALEQQEMGGAEQVKMRLALKKLMLPEGGMGDTFKVLVQAKGVDAPQLLCQRDWTRGF